MQRNGERTDDFRTDDFGDGTREVIAAQMEVQSVMGPGLLESVYEACLCEELRLRGLRVTRQVPLPLFYKGIALDIGYRLDVVVDGRILVELKTVDRLIPIHQAQVITYLRLAGLSVGLLANMNDMPLRKGLRRLTPSKPSARSYDEP